MEEKNDSMKLLQEMKWKYPKFMISSSEDGTIFYAFLYSKQYKDFEVKYSAKINNGEFPKVSLGANIFEKNEFQYSVCTRRDSVINSLDWEDKLKHLEELIDGINRKGFGSIRKKLNGGAFESNLEKF